MNRAGSSKRGAEVMVTWLKMCEREKQRLVELMLTNKVVYLKK